MNTLNAYAGQFLKTYEKSRYTISDYHSDYFPTKTTQPQIIIPPAAEEFADVSLWQEDINWDKYIQNARACIPKISQGNWLDPKWIRNYDEGRRVGCLLGGYHFVDDRYHPDLQTETILKGLQGRHLDMELMLDWERIYGGPYPGLGNVLKIHSNLKSEGVKCEDVGVYSGYYWVVDHCNLINNPQEFAYVEKHNVPFWIAWYANPEIVKIPAPWKTWVHWQKGTPVYDWGQASKEIDINHPNATPEQFTIKYGAGTQPPPGGNMPNETHQGTVTVTSLRLRTGPGTTYPESYPPLGGLRLNDTIFGEWDKDSTQWFNFARIVRADGTEEKFTGWCSALRGDQDAPYVRVEVIPTTPPPTVTLPIIHYQRTETFSADGYPDKTVVTTFDWEPNA